MFWSFESLKCTGCSERFPIPLDDVCVYTDGDLDLRAQNLAVSPSFHPVLRRRAWCVECNRPVLAERLPSIQEFMKAAALTKRFASKPPDHCDELLELPLEAQQHLFEKLAHRTSPGRCLTCGSKDWFGLDLQADGKLKPLLLHDACNSPFEWQGGIASFLRRAGTVRVRALSFDGELLAQAML